MPIPFIKGKAVIETQSKNFSRLSSQLNPKHRKKEVYCGWFCRCSIWKCTEVTQKSLRMKFFSHFLSAIPEDTEIWRKLFVADEMLKTNDYLNYSTFSTNWRKVFVSMLKTIKYYSILISKQGHIVICP